MTINATKNRKRPTHRPGFDPLEYRYTVEWSDEDQAFVSRVSEFASLAVHGDSPEKALREIRKVVGYVIEDLETNKEPVPVPFSKREYSGRLNLRMPKDLHRKLVLESETQGISLNALINSKLNR